MLRNFKNTGVQERIKNRPRDVAAKILDIIDPALQPRTDVDSIKAHDNLRESLVNLCTSAYQFALQLRCCTDLYKFETPTLGARLNEKEEEAQYMEEKSGNEPGDSLIAYVIFGAFVRYPKDYPEKRYVLEKAHVVIYS